MYVKEELNSTDLEMIHGGTADEKAEMDAIIKSIDAKGTAIPNQIRDEIIKTYKTYGKKAAKGIAEKLTKGHPEWANIVDLLK